MHDLLVHVIDRRSIMEYYKNIIKILQKFRQKA